MLSAQVKQDAKNYNNQFDLFEIAFYDGSKSKYYKKYGVAYRAASSYIKQGRYLSLHGLSLDGNKELAAC